PAADPRVHLPDTHALPAPASTGSAVSTPEPASERVRAGSATETARHHHRLPLREKHRSLAFETNAGVNRDQWRYLPPVPCHCEGYQAAPVRVCCRATQCRAKCNRVASVPE